MKRAVLFIIACWSLLAAAEVYTTFDVKAEQRSDLTLTATGVIAAIRVDVGDHVKKGEVLLRLENTDLERAVELAQADLELSEVNRRFALQSYERYQKVRDVIDEERFDQFRMAYEKSTAALNAAKAKLAYQKALLEKSILRAPYDGVIAERHKEVGDGVSGAMIAPILTMVSDRRVKLLLSFDEKHWQQVRPGAKVTYRVDGSDRSYGGTIAKVYPTVDAKSRKAYAELYAEGLMPGLFGEGTIEVE